MNLSVHLSILILFGLGLNPFQKEKKDDCFKNPLIEKGADPWVIKHDSLYHYCYSSNNGIYIKSAADLVKIQEAPARKIWEGVPGTNYSSEVWAPELHFYKNRWYVYFAADDGKNENHRMYVLESETDSLSGKFVFKGKLNTENDRWAIDGTLLPLNNKLYFIWSGWDSTVNVCQNLYISEMSSPTEVKKDALRVLISSPEFGWEKIGNPLINEGPQILKSEKGEVFLVYSASGSWTDSYCLGMLKLTGKNPMDAAAWQKYTEPVFQGTEEVISPGHCSFTKIGSSDWIVYHVARFKGAGWNRSVKMQKFRWVRGEPVFGKPIRDGECIELND